MVLLEFSMIPLDKGDSFSEHVATLLDIIDTSGLDYRFHAMGTILEGEWDEVMAVVTQCFETLRRESGRITTTMKLDYRRGATGRLRSKPEAVEQRLGRSLKTS